MCLLLTTAGLNRPAMLQLGQVLLLEVCSIIAVAREAVAPSVEAGSYLRQ